MSTSESGAVAAPGGEAEGDVDGLTLITPVEAEKEEEPLVVAGSSAPASSGREGSGDPCSSEGHMFHEEASEGVTVAADLGDGNFSASVMRKVFVEGGGDVLSPT